MRYHSDVTGPRRFDLLGRGLGSEETREIASALGLGALIVYPTDTLYAIGCCALDGPCVSRLRAAKGREEDKPFPVIATDLAQARSLTSRWPEVAQRLAERFWPGPLTLVVPAASTLPVSLLSGATSIAVRVPDSEVARALARAAGPLVATSANRAGEPPCVEVDPALAAFPLATLALDIGPLDGAPSTIVDVTDPSGAIRILREGRIAGDLVERALRRA